MYSRPACVSRLPGDRPVVRSRGAIRLRDAHLAGLHRCAGAGAGHGLSRVHTAHPIRHRRRIQRLGGRGGHQNLAAPMAGRTPGRGGAAAARVGRWDSAGHSSTVTRSCSAPCPHGRFGSLSRRTWSRPRTSMRQPSASRWRCRCDPPRATSCVSTSRPGVRAVMPGTRASDRATRGFGAPRFRALYRVWLEGRDGVVDETVSPSLADAIARGVGRLECTVLAHRYRHLVRGERVTHRGARQHPAHHPR